jgi:site-specific recombinase XerD
MNTHYVQDWLAWLSNVRRLKDASISCYSDTMHAFVDWLNVSNAVSSWDDVTAEQIEAFMGRVRRRNIVGAPATQDRDRVCITQFYNWMMMRGYVRHSPAINVGIPKIDNRAPKAIDDQVWEQLWNSQVPDEDRVWLGLACFAGLRRQEIAFLQPSQIDSRRGMILGLKRKGGKEEVVEYEQMAMILHDHLPRLLPDPERWLHTVAVAAHDRRGEHVLITMDTPAPATTFRRMSTDDVLAPDPAVLNKRLVKLLTAAELPPRLFAPHALRHTCVTNLLRCGVSIEVVSDCVGHGNIDTTRRYVKSAGRLADWRSRLAPKTM